MLQCHACEGGVLERSKACQSAGVRNSALQCVAVRCSLLQCVAAFYSVLQCVAVCCGVTFMCDVTRPQSSEGSECEVQWECQTC